MTAMPKFVISLLILCGVSDLGAQLVNKNPPGQVKEWRFPVRKGELLITLFAVPDVNETRNSISITTIGIAAAPTPDDEASDLRTVLGEMKSLGYPPTAIKSIHIGILDDQTLKQLQLAAANSREWRDCTHIETCSGEAIILRLLGETGAYNELVLALNDYGLTAKLAYVEDLLAKECPDPRKNINGTEAKLVLPIDALLELSVSRMSSAR